MSLYDRLRIATAVVTWYLLNRHVLLHAMGDGRRIKFSDKVSATIAAVPLSFATGLGACLVYVALYWVATGVVLL